MGGQVRIRVRFGRLASPWMDYLLASPEEMEELVRGTGWEIRRLIRDESAHYAAVIGRTSTRASARRSP